MENQRIADLVFEAYDELMNANSGKAKVLLQQAKTLLEEAGLKKSAPKLEEPVGPRFQTSGVGYEFSSDREFVIQETPGCFTIPGNLSVKKEPVAEQLDKTASPQ